MKIDRLLGIVMLLIQQRGMTAKALAEHFDVSVRTIQRDIDTLSVSGIPITALKGPNGGYGLLESYTLDKTFLKPEELHLLTDLINGFGHIIRDGKLLNLTDKINSLNNEPRYEYESLIRFDFMPWLPHLHIKKKLEAITKAITSRLLATITYVNQKSEETLRTIECYQLWLKETSWYVYAYCREKQEFRIFKLNRIKSLDISGETFEPRYFQVEDPFEYMQKELIDIELKFNMSAQGRIEDYFTEEDIRYTKDYILVKTKYPYDSWLCRTLLSFGAEVKVISPLRLQKDIKAIAQQIIENYSD
jgi:predicted DNA-binding transcriptional regulator YafY